MPVQYIYESAALDSGLSATRITRHLYCSTSVAESKSLGNFSLLPITPFPDRFASGEIIEAVAERTQRRLVVSAVRQNRTALHLDGGCVACENHYRPAL